MYVKTDPNSNKAVPSKNANYVLIFFFSSKTAIKKSIALKDYHTTNDSTYYPFLNNHGITFKVTSQKITNLTSFFISLPNKKKFRN